MRNLFPNFKQSHSPNIFLYYLTQAMYALCSSGGVDGIYRYPGETSPERVEMGIGESVNISCHMYPPWFPGKNSSDLYFVGGPAQEPVDENDIAIVNASTIVLMLRNATERQTSYICKIGEEAIMASKVNVGTAPKVVNDFNCRSYDLDYMLCNFTQPENPVLTQYNLTFHTISLDYIYQPLCNYEHKGLVVCNITLPQKYNPTIDDFHFTLKAMNALGTLTQYFNINIWNVMIPARPGSGFRINDISTDKLQATWKMINYSDRFKALQWEVLIKPENGDNASWLNTSSNVVLMRSKMDIRLRLYDLPFAFYWYLLRIRCHVRTAVDPEHMWSQPFFYRFQTKAKRPDAPPRVDVGSFYVEPTETQVRLYWEELPEYRRNGYNFSYKITEIKKNGKAIHLAPLRLELNSAVYSWQRNAHYEFFIKSSNHIGESLNASRLEIMPFIERSYLTHTPRPIHNVYDATNRSYTLTWEPPESKKDLLDYTVYWCRSKRALQNECKGSIYFSRIKKHELRFTTESQSPQEEHTLNMAVSANYLNYNTGMHWTPCTVDISSDLVKMSPDIQALSSSAVRIQLSPENVCPSILQGYNLTYCELAASPFWMNTTQPTETKTLECIKPAHTLILNKNLKQYDLSGLMAYTHYRFEVFMFSPKKVGKSSDPIVVRTHEAAPSPPRQLTVYNITNTSATLSWLSPSQPNGIIRYYIVLLNNHKYRISANSENNNDADVPKFVFHLRNLSSFTAYKVYVVARTVDNSEPSNDIHFSTLVGFPSVPRNIVVKGKNIIQWTKPLEPSGRVDFYEVAVLIKRNDELIRKRISIVTSVTCELQEVPACSDHEHKTILEVRAINAALKSHEINPSESVFALENWHDKDENEDLYEDNDDLSCLEGKKKSSFQYYRDKSSYIFYKSDWQSGPTYGCATTRLSKITIIAFVVVVFSVTATIVIRNKYNKMANIDCALPAGLENYSRSKFNDQDVVDKIGTVDEYSNKKLFIDNEKYHLLTPVGMDTTFFGGGGVGGGFLPLNEDLNSFDNMHKSLENSMNSMSLQQNRSDINLEPDQVGKTANSVENLNTENSPKNISTGDTSSLVSTSMPNNSPGYLSQSSKINNFSQGMPTFENSENPLLNSKSQCGDGVGGGYISVGSIVNSSLLKNNYIQSSQAIQQNLIPPTIPLEANKNEGYNSSTNGCYIQFNNFNKTQSPINQELFPGNSSRDRIAEGSGKIISGYVTQRDLTVFGQQRLY